MKTRLTFPQSVSLLALGGALALGPLVVGCVSTRTSSSTGEYVDDTVITSKVKAALLGEEHVKSFAISVETYKGVVQLSGFVNTAAQKARAASAAKGVRGVTEVRNNLIVK